MVKGEWKTLIKALEAAGYECAVGKSGHYLVRNAQGQRVWNLPYSASDHRSYQNALRDLKRALGFTLPKKGARS